MESRSVSPPKHVLRGAQVRLVWGETTLAVRYCPRGRALVAGTEPDCDFILPPLPGLARWRAQLLAWRSGELLARLPRGWKCHVSQERTLEILPPSAGTPIRLLISLSHARSRSRAGRLLPMMALVAVLCGIVSPPLCDILRADPSTRLDGGLPLMPVFVQVQAEGTHSPGQPAADPAAVAARPPTEGPSAQQTWIDLIRRWSFSGLNDNVWLSRWRYGILPSPNPPLWVPDREPVPPVDAELVRTLPRPSNWVPTGQLPFPLRVRARECIRVPRGAQAESWLWIGGAIERGRLKQVWLLEYDSASERELACLAKQLENQASGLPYERSTARFALHRPGTPMTELSSPPDQDSSWSSDWYPMY